MATSMEIGDGSATDHIHDVAAVDTEAISIFIYFPLTFMSDKAFLPTTHDQLGFRHCVRTSTAHSQA